MIRYARGDLLQADVEALVNPVNTVGVMGKGLALKFKQAYPKNFQLYLAACRARTLAVGQLLVTHTRSARPRLVVNFPTKQHWRDPSQLEWIERGLHHLRTIVEAEGITSIAVPALGCGNGGLSWTEVQPLIEKFLWWDDVDVVVYEP